MQPFEERLFSCGEGQGGKELEEIAKVVAADRLYSVYRIFAKIAVPYETHTPMEGNPTRLVREHQAGRDHELREIVWEYPKLLVSLEINAGLLEEFDRFRREHVLAGTGD